MKKYRLTDEAIKHNGVILYRIEALMDFGIISAGDKGGFVQSELNLSQEGNCWIHDEAKVFGNAIVYGNASVFGRAKVYGNAFVKGDAIVFDDAKVYGNASVNGDATVCDKAEVFGVARVYGNAFVKGNAIIKTGRDYIVFKNWWSSGRYFTWTRSNNMWNVGCFYGSGKELIKKAYADSEESGREYERVVRYVESILAD